MKKVRGILQSASEIRLIEPLATVAPGTEVDVLVPETGPEVTKPARNGRELLERLRKSGFIGRWKDRTDITSSYDYARQLREQAQTRRHES